MKQNNKLLAKYEKNLFLIETFKQNNEEIKDELHKEYKKNNRSYFNIVIILFILGLIFNVGAMVITNMMVMNTGNVVIAEANPVVSDVYGFDEHPDARPLYIGFMFHAFLYIILVWYFLYQYNRVYNNNRMIQLYAFTTMLITILALDFFNDFGFLLGKFLFA